MAFEIYETHELLPTVENFHPVPSFWLDSFFPNLHISNTEYIDFETISKGRRLAPYVMPHIQGQPMREQASALRKVKPAYLKPKSTVDANRVIRRRVGEPFFGSLSPQQREDAIVNDIMQDHSDMIERRWEQMASQAVRTGQIVIAGENYPSVTVDFGRASGNTVTLTGTARWGQSAADPITNIRAWVQTTFRSGRSANRLIMSPEAADAFLADPKVKALMDTRRGSTMQLESATVTDAVAYSIGTLPGTQVQLWVYNDIYEDNDGNEVRMLPAGEVILAGDVGGIRAFGAILDRKANYNSVPKFPKMWESDDPAGLFLMTQSAPLMIPTRPNASLRANVL